MKNLLFDTNKIEFTVFYQFRWIENVMMLVKVTEKVRIWREENSRRHNVDTEEVWKRKGSYAAMMSH